MLCDPTHGRGHGRGQVHRDGEELVEQGPGEGRGLRV